MSTEDEERMSRENCRRAFLAIFDLHKMYTAFAAIFFLNFMPIFQY
jgi:hypothetical protein